MKKNISKKVFKKPAKLATATAHETRLNIFQATRRPSTKDEIIQTAWGKVRIKGKLGQGEQDVLESLFFSAIKKRTYKDGKITIVVDPAKVRKTARLSSETALDNAIFNLVNTTIEIFEPKKLAAVGGLISFIDKSSDITAKNPTISFKKESGERHFWEIEIGQIIKRLWDADILLWHDPSDICKFKHGASQALARLVIGHKENPNGGWHLNTLIRQTCGDIDKQKLKDRRKEIKKDSAALAKIGIVIEKDRVNKQV